MNNIDFLPERIRLQRRRRLNLIRQGHMLVLCVAGLALLGYVRQARIGVGRAEVTLLGERSASLARQIVMRGALEERRAELLMKERIGEHLGSRVSALDIMGELEQIMSDRLTLTDMTIEAMDVPVPIEVVAGSVRARRASAARPEPRTIVTRRLRLVLTGLSPTDIDVADFIGQVASSPLFEDIEMGYSRTAEYNNRKVREFQVTCFVVR